MSRIKKLLYLILVLTIIAFSAYYYVFIYSTTHHRNLQSEKAIIIQANSLSAAYQINEKNANTLYLNKAVEVSGTLLSIGKNQEGKTTLILGSSNSLFNVSVSLNSTEPITQKVGETITIKGVCTGALSDVIITEGVVK